MKICFVDYTDFVYDSELLYSKNLRGAESVIINLSNSLSRLGADVTVINNCKENKIINKVNWININTIKKPNDYDLVIANGDCRLFKYANSTKNILFSHSIQSVEKFLRKKQLFSYFKYKPKICFLSNYHKNNRTRLLYIFGYIRLKWAVDSIFQKAIINNNIVNPNLAIFTSRPDRNLELLLNIWSNKIITKVKDVKILVSEHHFKFKDKSIIERSLSDQRNLVKDLQSSRMCLIPGHRAELFCLAAEEAKIMCVPIVTLGIGSLKERVLHNITGLIANNYDDFANYAIKLFLDNKLWINLRNNLIRTRHNNNWTNVAKNLISQCL